MSRLVSLLRAMSLNGELRLFFLRSTFLQILRCFCAISNRVQLNCVAYENLRVFTPYLFFDSSSLRREVGNRAGVIKVSE